MALLLRVLVASAIVAAILYILYSIDREYERQHPPKRYYGGDRKRDF
jgi:hypothetical protein